MKKSVGFWESLEKYGWKVVGRSPLPRYWTWIVMVVVGVIIITSWAYHEISVVGERGLRGVVEHAAALGDYILARELLTKQQTNKLTDNGVLGAESELEDMVYPERVVERRIAEIEEKLLEYPGNKEIYLLLSSLYDQLGNETKASEYREKARILDPNGAEFR